MIHENYIMENRFDLEKRLDSLYKYLLLEKVKCKNNLNSTKVNSCLYISAGIDIYKIVSVSPELIVGILKSEHSMSNVAMECLADLITNIKESFDGNIKSHLTDRTDAIYKYVDEQYFVELKNYISDEI